MSIENTQEFITVNGSFLYPCGEEPGTSKKSENFGICKLVIPQASLKFYSYHWILNIDRSASMLDVCPDGKTKIEHLKHMLVNMIKYFVKLQNDNEFITQYLTIIMFDHTVETICTEEKIDKHIVDGKLETIISRIVPRGATNIESALTEASEHLKKIFKSENYDKTHQTTHIFMSDGNITSGSTIKPYLKEKLNLLPDIIPNYIATNTFIGFGSEHDASLLRTLSDIRKGEYYFVDSIENAGMVYGEVIYNSLYECIKKITISVNNGEIYDYKNDTWGSTLYIDSIASGQTRTWHIRRKTEYNSEETETSASSSSASSSLTRVTVSWYECQEQSKDDSCDDEETEQCNMISDTVKYPDTIDKEVEKYLWRQRTQEMMKKINNYIVECNQEDSQKHDSQKHDSSIQNDNKSFTSFLYPGAFHHNKTKNELFSRPKLQRNNKFGGFETQALTPPSTPQSSPLENNSAFNDKFIKEHSILDEAKRDNWKAVRTQLTTNPALIHSFPQPRRFNLLHHAIHQQNVKEVEHLLKCGINPYIKTRDNISCKKLAENTSTVICGAIHTLLDKYENSLHYKFASIYSPSLRKDNTEIPAIKDKNYYLKQLDDFMCELKQYMTDHLLEDDEFMKNLCDDIYVCTKSLTSTFNTSRMYLGIRSSSQGNERAYNVSNFQDLDINSQPVSTTYRNLSQHQTSDNTQTAYISRGATSIMRAVSEGIIEDI